MSLVQGAPPLASAAFRYLGNTPELSQAQSSTKLDHFDADHGLRQKDDSIILQLDRTGKFKADSMDVENLALFFLANNTTYSQTAATAVVETPTVSPGTGVQLGTSVNASGLRGITNLVVTNFAEHAPMLAKVLFSADAIGPAANGFMCILKRRRRSDAHHRVAAGAVDQRRRRDEVAGAAAQRVFRVDRDAVDVANILVRVKNEERLVVVNGQSQSPDSSIFV